MAKLTERVRFEMDGDHYLEMYGEIDQIVTAWEEVEAGKVPGRELTPWERERLNFARDLLDKIDEAQPETDVVVS